jgi:hypothetical protein
VLPDAERAAQLVEMTPANWIERPVRQLRLLQRATGRIRAVGSAGRPW